MINTKATLLMVLFSAGVFTSVRAQEGTVTSGGEATGNTGSVSVTVGQMDFITINDETAGNIRQGIQQNTERGHVSKLDAEDVNLEVSVFPNPAEEFVIISASGADAVNLSYVFFDLQGRQIANAPMPDNKATVNIKPLAAASYIVKIMKDNSEVKEIKIIKN